MVAYNFKAQFRAPILAGTKRQTIRADRKRHARPGETLQLYTGMRTKYCSLIGRALCESAEPIQILVEAGLIDVDGTIFTGPHALDMFARTDGFDGWAEMQAFWSANHPGEANFYGVLIRWGDLLPWRHDAPTTGDGEGGGRDD